MLLIYISPFRPSINHRYPANHFGNSEPGSREQNYRPEDCGVCHASLTARKGHGFWEGGKGEFVPKKPSLFRSKRFFPRTKPKWPPVSNHVSDFTRFSFSHHSGLNHQYVDGALAIAFNPLGITGLHTPNRTCRPQQPPSSPVPGTRAAREP